MALRHGRAAGLRRAASRRAGFVALAAALYLAAGIAATWPAVLHARSHFLSGGAPVTAKLRRETICRRSSTTGSSATSSSTVTRPGSIRTRSGRRRSRSRTSRAGRSAFSSGRSGRCSERRRTGGGQPPARGRAGRRRRRRREPPRRRAASWQRGWASPSPSGFSRARHLLGGGGGGRARRTGQGARAPSWHARAHGEHAAARTQSKVEGGAWHWNDDDHRRRDRSVFPRCLINDSDLLLSQPGEFRSLCTVRLIIVVLQPLVLLANHRV